MVCEDPESGVCEGDTNEELHLQIVTAIIVKTVDGCQCNCAVSRLAWAVVVIASMSLFVVLVINKVKLVMSVPKSVNVDIGFLETIQFPAVTICNQNKYRSVSDKLFTTTLSFFCVSSSLLLLCV